MKFQFKCKYSSHFRRGPGRVAEQGIHTKHYEASVRISGAERILGCAAVHGAVELSWNPLQNQLLPLPLGAAIQQAAPHSRPGEQGLREHFILSTPSAHTGWRRREKREQRGGG